MSDLNPSQIVGISLGGTSLVATIIMIVVSVLVCSKAWKDISHENKKNVGKIATWIGASVATVMLCALFVVPSVYILKVNNVDNKVELASLFQIILSVLIPLVVIIITIGVYVKERISISNNNDQNRIDRMLGWSLAGGLSTFVGVVLIVVSIILFFLNN